MKNEKIYTSFTDKFGNAYGFETYAEFAAFWFNIAYRTAKATFPMFAKLQKAAANSKEARAKLAI
jgi:hypothetical protein